MLDSGKLYRRILAPVAVLLAINVGAFAWIVWRHLNEDVVANLHGYAGGLDRMLVTILKESMRRDDRDTLRSAIENFSGLDWVRQARIIDKQGEIKFSSDPAETGTQISIASETCRECHRRDPAPMTQLSVVDAATNGEVLRAAETIRAERVCQGCHHVPVGTALGVLVLDLDMGPLSHDVRDRARRNLLLLVIGSIALLGILLYLVRTLVVGRIQRLADAVGALRAGQRIHAPDSPADEIDDLKETLAALGADLEGRRFASALLRSAERALGGHGTPILLLDADGAVLIANDEAQAELDADLDALVGRRYAELGGGRGELWELGQQLPLVLYPHAREDRGPHGADRALAQLRDTDGETIGFLEVGRRVEPPAANDRDDDGEPDGASDRANDARGDRAMLPERFLHGPYGVDDPTADHVLRGILLLASLTKSSLDKGGILELDPALANTVRAFERLTSFRSMIDEQVDRCDMAAIVRNTANDFRRARPGATRWHVLSSPPTPMVGHPVLLRQLVTLALEQALASKPRDVVVFVQRQASAPRFFLGVWVNAVDDAARQSVRWRACVDLVRRFSGEVELDPAYDLEALGKVHGGRLPKLGRGALLLAEFPCTPA